MQTFREIDGHHDKINNAYNVPNLPTCFYSSTPHRKVLDNHGHLCKKLPNLNGNRLVLRHKSLDNILSSKTLQSRRFETILRTVTGLSDTIGGYSSFLLRKSESSQKNHARTTPLELDRQIIDIPAKLNTGKSHWLLYRNLDEALQNLSNYEAFNLLTIAPDDPVSRYRWLIGISLNVPVKVYKIKKKSIAFIWKIDSNEDPSVIESKTLNLIGQIDSNIIVSHTRAMKRKATEMFKNNKHWTDTDLTTLYNIITGGETNDKEESVATIKDKIEAGMDIEQIYNEEETESLNRNGKFDNFWKSVDSLIKDHTTPHERRHGSMSYISPLCPSIRALMETAKHKMEELYPGDASNFVPSYEWFRRQFSPRNVYANVSTTFTGRFDAKRGLQQRLLRKFHIDHHYGAKQLCFFKEHASR